MKQISSIYARLSNKYKFKNQTVFSARLDKQDEDDRVLDEIDLYINLNIKRKTTQSDIDKIDVRYQSEYQIQNQESKYSCWKFDKTN